MTTYEHGKAPADAPVTWNTRSPNSDYIIEFNLSGTTCGFAATFHTTGKVSNVADAVCRAFHLAALADEAAPVVEAFGTDAGGFRGYWLRRYRAAKGEQ